MIAPGRDLDRRPPGRGERDDESEPGRDGEPGDPRFRSRYPPARVIQVDPYRRRKARGGCQGLLEMPRNPYGRFAMIHGSAEEDDLERIVFKGPQADISP